MKPTLSFVGAGHKSERGMTLLELMIAMLVLAIGLGALTILFASAMLSNNKNSKDTSATLLSQMVIEQVTAQHPSSTATITVTDCAGNNWTIATTGGAVPNGAGAALVTLSTSLNYGGIDQTQVYSAIPAGYAMQYVDCGTNGRQVVYDVRWNVMTMTTNNTRLVTASARKSEGPANQLGGRIFAMPVTLRGIGGT